ncbi:subclass B3 metallo-beta-lactamase [Altererythrobacter sp.]|uniref:subclass B3 metallo-beta-lactamase n=1 Tax=Altererythrobacter sp. TaxID=1872480 RepID=UPI001B225217|nr:subclass B3 metallo-beta-lactamase [Altererythrobacter sp.]MBO6608171.1 subclass B3 metallo-beta-lactamase [Altererythrobacter sp.]MBO6641573.1 subclass B3 metallo-beta-lactamase [Altererythrobacter sp.]MBO6707728.1 subclass B3 metallo-beta-lactamase [Altererythrobacter sp.]
MFVRAILASCMIMAACAQSFAQPDAAIANSSAIQSEIARFAYECEKWDEWEKPASPFRIHGDTYYVGTCGIAAILIAGPNGHVLIDSGTEGGSKVVEDNIATLGFSIDDVQAILTSHEHYDHVGGLNRLQKLSRATVYTSTEAAPVLRTGAYNPRDPQAGLHDPMTPVTGDIRVVADGEVLNVGNTKVTSIATPGHTLGAMSWQWKSCEADDCLSIVYADSLSPVSADNYRFTDHPEYVATFRKGIARLREFSGSEYDMLLTPHPSASNMLERMKSGTLEGGMTCIEYANAVERRLNARLERETSASE